MEHILYKIVIYSSGGFLGPLPVLGEARYHLTLPYSRIHWQVPTSGLSIIRIQHLLKHLLSGYLSEDPGAFGGF